MLDPRGVKTLHLLAAPLCCWLLGGAFVVGDDQVGASDVRFETEIRPVLLEHCIECHGASKQEGGLRLDSAEALQVGGDSGPALLAGEPSKSLLLEALKYESFEMPPSGQLNERTVEQVEAWIAEGALWPENSPLLRAATERISPEDRQWWAFRPLVRPDRPSVADTTWPVNAIDTFVLARMEAAQLTPAPRAESHVLVRRLYFDMLGMPPTPQELTESCRTLNLATNEPSSQETAWESLVDRLLDDPRYGEHWARHWLDLVRYSESDGWNADAYRPEIWRYRDYVVNSFNSDKPYPDFVREQMAGDEIDANNPEFLIAAGFLRLGIYEYNQRDARAHWDDILNEITDVTGDVFLGMSFACARCHDHKFDPLPQRDYFQLRAFFEPLIWRDDLEAATTEQRSEYEHQVAKWQAATQDVHTQIDALINPYYERKWQSTVEKFPLDIQACYNKPTAQRSSWDEQMSYLIGRQFWEEAGGPLKTLTAEDKKRLDALQAELAAWDELKPVPLPKAMTVSNHIGTYTPTTIPSDPDQLPIDPGFPTVMSQLDLPTFATHQAFSQQANDLANATKTATQVDSIRLVSNHSQSAPTGARRLQLAEWIGHRRNPLTSRVIVNRIWQQHFGRGLVSTSNDFGRVGAAPSHPELLDWLTDEFIAQDWSFKKLHKQILMSSTWRQSAHHPRASEFENLDPDDQLLWRAPVRRLQAEQIRDAMLLASGELVNQVGGPAVDEQSPRRALYVKSFRNNLENFLSSFDRAGGLKSVSVRDSTTTPTQALLLINGSYTLTRAE
ncbi:MAG: PSD1 and planctomycete cytochrome C domain-containing protein, partial [Aureliella sp.]